MWDESPCFGWYRLRLSTFFIRAFAMVDRRVSRSVLTDFCSPCWRLSRPSIQSTRHHLIVAVGHDGTPNERGVFWVLVVRMVRRVF